MFIIPDKHLSEIKKKLKYFLSTNKIFFQMLYNFLFANLLLLL